jgi:hypothetical protein
MDGIGSTRDRRIGNLCCPSKELTEEHRSARAHAVAQNRVIPKLIGKTSP